MYIRVHVTWFNMYNVYTCMYIQVPLAVLLSAPGHSSLVDLAAVPPENALNVKSTCTCTCYNVHVLDNPMATCAYILTS